MIDLIIYRNGYTNFDNPLQEAYEICKKNPDKYDKFLLYFMSDGESEFPEQGINRLLEDYEFVEKIEFHSIAFGPVADKDIL